MQVYRVEDEDGGGPYNGRRSVNYDDLFGLGLGPELWERNPPPRTDIPEWTDIDEDDRRKYKFGFASLDQLYNWFPPQMIKRLGMDRYFKVAVYEVPSDADILRGAHQIAFDKRVAKLVVRDPITKSSTEQKRSTEVDIPF